MQETKLIIIRHSETEWNTINRYQGQLNSDLTERGIEQAKAIGNRLKDAHFDAVYSSDLGRAVDTAKHILAYHPEFTLHTEASLRERDFGVLSGLTREEGLQQQPEIEAAYRKGDPEYRIPEGESFRDTYERTKEAMDAIAEKHLGKTVLIVTHGGILGMCFRYAIGLPLELPRRYHFFNASYNEFFLKDKTWFVGTWGDISHLGHIGTEDDM